MGSEKGKETDAPTDQPLGMIKRRDREGFERVRGHNRDGMLEPGKKEDSNIKTGRN